MNASTLKLRLAVLGCIFLGVLIAIAPTAGKIWQKIEHKRFGRYYDGRKIPSTVELWEYCEKHTYYKEYTVFSLINDRNLKKSIKGNYF